MREIKVLRKIIIVLFTLTLLWFLGDNIITVLAIVFEKDVLQLGHFNFRNTPLWLKFVMILKTLAFCLFFYASFLLIKILNLKNIIDFKNKKTSLYLNKAGVFIIISNSISFLLSFTIIFTNIKYAVYFNYDSKSLNLLMLVFGCFLIIFSKIMNKGLLLKQENDLTI